MTKSQDIRGGRLPRTAQERFEALSSDRQAALLDPAEAEFSEHGFEGASLNRILEGASISKGQAYYYARDKAALYSLVVERALDRIVEMVGPVALETTSPDTFWNSLTDVLERGTAELASNPQLVGLARGIYSAAALPRVNLAPLVRRIEGWLSHVIEMGQEAGDIRIDVPRSLLAAVVLGATLQADRWFGDHWSELTTDEAIERTGQLLELCRNMLTLPQEPSAVTSPERSLLDEVTAQAGALVPVLRALRAEMGADRANALVLGALAEERSANSKRAVSQAGGPSREAWTAAITDLGGRVADSAEYQWLRQERDVLDYDVTSCAFAQLFHSLGEPELGKVLVCDLDTDLATMNAPDVELCRDQTLMQGGACCTFRYKFQARKVKEDDEG